MKIYQYRELLKWATNKLQIADITGARYEAELLLAYAAGIRREDIYTRRESEACLPYDSAGFFRKAVERRCQREPLAYITGIKEFYGLQFMVDSRVLIPRPETELLVELCLQRLAQATQRYLVADLCTGSGAVGISLAIHRPDTVVLATDLSPDALEVASSNAKRHGVQDRVRFFRGDLCAPLASYAGGLDAILCNPPYIQATDLSRLQPEIRFYEPEMALDGGPDGLAFYRRLLAEADGFLTQDGFMLLEIGAGQLDAIMNLAVKNGWKTAFVSDLAGFPRIVAVEKSILMH